MSGRANIEIHVFVWDFQAITEVVRYSIVVMLTRVNETNLQLVFLLEAPDKRDHLQKVRPTMGRKLASICLDSWD